MPPKAVTSRDVARDHQPQKFTEGRTGGLVRVSVAERASPRAQSPRWAEGLGSRRQWLCLPRVVPGASDSRKRAKHRRGMRALLHGVCRGARVRSRSPRSANVARGACRPVRRRLRRDRPRMPRAAAGLRAPRAVRCARTLRRPRRSDPRRKGPRHVECSGSTRKRGGGRGTPLDSIRARRFDSSDKNTGAFGAKLASY